MGGELLFLMIVGLILFGPEELPKIARTVGKIIYDFKQAAEGITTEIMRSAESETELKPKPDFEFEHSPVTGNNPKFNSDSDPRT